MKRFFQIGFFLFFIHGFSEAQTFEIEQVNQFFRPRVKLEERYYFPAAMKDTAGNFSMNDAQVSLTIPVKTKLGLEISGDLSIKEIGKGVKVSQHLVTARAGYKNFVFSSGTHHLYNAAIGMMGVSIKLNRKASFYSVTAGISEEDHTVNKAVPRLTGIVGQMKINGFNKNHYYGLVLTYSDGLFLPVPFFGMEIPFNSKASFLFTLPARAGFNYSPDKKWSLNTFFSFDGFRSGIDYFDKRSNINYSAAQVAFNARYKIKRWLFVKLEAGFNMHNRLRLEIQQEPDIFAFANTPYVVLSLSSNFGKTIFSFLD